MKAVEGMVVREIAGETLLIPTGELTRQYNGLITVNEVSALIWKMLQEECTYEKLLQAVLDEFEVEEETARQDLTELLEKLKNMNLLVE